MRLALIVHSESVVGELEHYDALKLYVKTEEGVRAVLWTQLTGHSHFDIRSQIIDKDSAGDWMDLAEVALNFGMKDQVKTAVANAIRCDPTTRLKGEAFLRRHSHWPCVLAIGGACVLSFVVLAYVRSASKKENAGLERVITAVSAPPGLAHLEDPAILDGIAQAQGVMTGATPGTAAYFLIGVWGSRLQAVISLSIVAAFRWWLAVALLAGHLVTFRFRRWHWEQVGKLPGGK